MMWYFCTIGVVAQAQKTKTNNTLQPPSWVSIFSVRLKLYMSIVDSTPRILPLSLMLKLPLKLFPCPSPELMYIFDDDPFVPRKSTSQMSH
jgi:hypothetical protein